MEQLRRFFSRQVEFELKLGYLMPVFVGLAILLNAQISNPSVRNQRDFAPLAIHPSRYADYSTDPLDLQFAPIDLSIIQIAQLDNAPIIPADDQPPDVAASEAPSFGTPTPREELGSTDQPGPTATQQIGLPTLPLPTLPPLLPTLPPFLPTLPPLLPTLPPVLPTLPPIVPTLAAPIPTIVPLPTVPPIVPTLPCIPIPLVPACD